MLNTYFANRFHHPSYSTCVTIFCEKCNFVIHSLHRHLNFACIYTAWFSMVHTCVDGSKDSEIPCVSLCLVWFGVIFIRHGLYQDGVFKFTVYIPDNYPDGGCPVSSVLVCFFTIYIKSHSIYAFSQCLKFMVKIKKNLEDLRIFFFFSQIWKFVRSYLNS